MKKIVLMIAMMVSSSAFANTPEFVDGLVYVINQQLAVVNKQRAQDGEKLYCTELDGKQATLIASYFRNKKANAWLTLDSVNASRFIDLAGANLSCFPKPCKNYDDLVHGICNMKSYKMDRLLLRSALEQIKGGKVYINDTMADIAK
ncbi:hypothetical protein B9G69_010690 [Bdellovibrio sp. SKB1291214]|uniref:hypothetical protein n=1 Tax=Bdellovibrio sp. SKB1291214 TaxID=1732569 RepID=UPI000B518226|nr:hypothetical protein [Bdellovibrio sp. SKB1291214]UYL07511.1 hypothetical protein B9G69_010690 [Bdellovibrio sp. SKB1291214]